MGEILSNAHACLPQVHVEGLEDLQDLEVTIAVRASESDDTSLEHAQEALMQAMVQALHGLLQGKLPI